MSHPDRAAGEREVALELLEVLAPLFGESTPTVESTPTASYAARDVAQRLDLAGLGRLLSALAPHAGVSWPRPLDGALDRLRRLSARTAAEQHLTAFREADTELDALAGEIEAIEWSERGAAGSIPSVRVADAIADLPWDARGDAEATAEARLTAPAAAALRAALEWVSGDGGPRRPFEITLEDDSLSVAFGLVDPAGLPGAHAVLGPIGGLIGPWLVDPPAPGKWAVRVPVIQPRSRYLMFEQGGERFALPWLSVLRLSMWPANEPLAEHARSSGAPLLPRLVPRAHGPAPGSEKNVEHPLIVIASGLQRGSLAVDRVVWRLAAEAHVTVVRGPLHLERAARTVDGEQYWILEPYRLLASLPLPDVGSSHRRPRRIPDPPGPRVLTEHDVTPITGGKSAANVAAREPVAAVAAREPAAKVEGRDRVLIAEDSITARAFLSRMLEARGFEVSATGTAGEAMAELSRGGWALFFADVELPDARGADWLRAISELAPDRTPVIALVRDREDRESATVAGLSRVLRKPFDPAEVSELIERLTGAARNEP